jgi:hypothetical protein
MRSGCYFITDKKPRKKSAKMEDHIEQMKDETVALVTARNKMGKPTYM